MSFEREEGSKVRNRREIILHLEHISRLSVCFAQINVIVKLKGEEGAARGLVFAIN